MRSQATTSRPAAGRWFHAPVVWLGASILLASAAGIVAMFVAASRYPDVPDAPAGERLLKAPITRTADTATEPTASDVRAEDGR